MRTYALFYFYRQPAARAWRAGAARRHRGHGRRRARFRSSRRQRQHHELGEQGGPYGDRAREPPVARARPQTASTNVCSPAWNASPVSSRPPRCWNRPQRFVRPDGRRAASRSTSPAPTSASRSRTGWPTHSRSRRSSPGGIGLSKTTASELDIGARGTQPSPVSREPARYGHLAEGLRRARPETVGALAEAFMAMMPLANAAEARRAAGAVHTYPGPDRAGTRSGGARASCRRSPQAAHGRAGRPGSSRCCTRHCGRAARPASLFAAIARAAGFPVRVQRDAADRPGATPGDRRSAPRRHQAHRDRADGPLPGAVPGDRSVVAWGC